MAKSISRKNRMRIRGLPFAHPAREVLASAYALNISTLELARMIGVNYSTIHRWLTGKTEPRGEVLQRLLDVQAILRWRMEKERGARYPNQADTLPPLKEGVALPNEQREIVKDILGAMDNN